MPQGGLVENFKLPGHPEHSLEQGAKMGLALPFYKPQPWPEYLEKQLE
jgi:hypothetical protein